MPQSIKVTFRDFAPSPAVEADLRQRASALDTYCDRINHCEIVVAAPAIHHHRNGGPFSIGIRLTVPDAELVADHQEEADLSVATREAFSAIRRRLQDHVRVQRGRKPTS